MVTRSPVLFVSTCLALIINANSLAGRPNVLVVLTDDQGYGDIRSHGNSGIQTPHQDALAKAGIRFDRFYVSPVCAPTRASLLTGRWHLRTGVHGVTRGYETMRSEEVTLAEIFQSAGYATAAFGKWHNGAHFPEHPRGQGFQSFTGFCGGHFNNYFDATLQHNDETVVANGFVIDRLTDYAIQFIEDRRDQSWFCYLAFNTPHSPWQVPDKYWQRYVDRNDLPDDKARCAYAMVENIDDNLGRMVAAINKLGLDKDTIVVFVTDNGANSDRYNAGMRGRKGSVHEGGSRVPCFVCWPGKIPTESRLDRIAAHVDLLPTLCELADVTVPRNLAIDGQSLAKDLLDPQLSNERTRNSHSDRLVFTHWGDNQDGQPRTDRGAVRSQQFRAVLENGRWQLYDMVADPGQRRDLASSQPQTVRQLADAFHAWFDDVTKAGFAPIPIQVGHNGHPLVTLPGHEATLHPVQGKGIHYQGRAGWANDWITRWTDSDAFATWELEVVRAGRFQVLLHYAATDDQANNAVQVSVGQQSVTSVLRAMEPSTRPVSQDRIPRTEVHERSWAVLPIGYLDLQPGRQQLKVEAATLAADSLFDLKAVSLERIKPAATTPTP